MEIEMDLSQAVKKIDLQAARAFVSAARPVIDALLIEAEPLRPQPTPQPRDYATAELSRAAPPSGWITHAELSETVRRMNQALAAEKWTEGVLFALQALYMLGAL
jgi:hypothetical protein